MKVVGIEKVDYVSKKTNQRVEGVNLHCVSDPVTSESMKGQTVERIFVSAKSVAWSVASVVELGHEIKIFYNRWGNVDDILDQTVQPVQPDKSGK